MERVVLVGIERKGPGVAREDGAGLAELERLAETAGARVVGALTQRLERFHPGTLIGAGKIRELEALARAGGARTVVFDEDLSPAQQLALEKAVSAKIVDRTRLILDIFARRARTKEGELQVELAQLSYMLPRLTGSWRAFSQQVGGIGTRGPGERKIEYERRHIQRRIRHLKRALETVEVERATQRARRARVPVPSVAIIGYTNAGKSTLLNRLAELSPAGGKAVYADDKLFATLDPTTRRVRLPSGGWAAVTDTVGFIAKLPTALIAAFRATLEETLFADCLLQLEDGAGERLEAQRAVVEGVLAELGAGGLPRVFAVNKADLLAPERSRELAARHPERLFVSASGGAGVDALLRQVESVLAERWLPRELALDPAQGGRLKEIYECAQVLGRSMRGGKLVVRLRATPENWSRLRSRFCAAS